jgi:Domain of unknown function (DUF4082)/Fibronectin type III domain
LRYHHRPRAAARLRKISPLVNALETRALLSTTGFVAHPMFVAVPYAGSGPGGGFTPAQIQQAYGFNKVAFGGVKGDGTGQTIAIIDAYDDPNIQNDLNTFSSQFGLSATTVVRVNQTGGTSYPSTDGTGGWEIEESLDVEWAHAVAPGATIMLVEARSPTGTDLMAAVDYASAHASVVSMSWGGGEFSGQTAYDSHFSHPGVTYVASSGDSGAPISWPAASADVVAVGGTALTVDSSNNWSSETGWSGSGGGPSAYVSKPAYQTGVVTGTTTRANPDVAYDASPSTGFSVYDTFLGSGWYLVGGTSAGAPQWAGLFAIANQGRAIAGQPAIDATSPQEALTILYGNAATGAFHDITTGTSTGSPNYTAGPGYDFVTGIGTPLANRVVQALDGNVSTSGDHLVVTATTSTVTAGASLSVTVAAQSSGGTTDATYRGTVHFTSSDGQAVLPADYTFTASDVGAHTFSLTLKTAGTQSVTVTDTSSSAAAATLPGVVVSPAAASQILLTGLPSAAVVGTPMTLTVTLRDPYNNTATGYTGTVSFTSTDAQAGLPAAYKYTAGDAGSHTFSLSLGTPGTQTVTVTDTAAGLSATSAGVAVSLAAPTNLSAKVASNTEIDLTWSPVTGAGGYSVERSANGSTVWAVIGATATGVTTYQNIGLTAGTTYDYRVRASTGGVFSGYSSVVAATTTGGTTAGTSDTLWSNTYVPPENAYGYGSYELGVKIRTDVAGAITGLRFYKQTWMSGYAHVGHLWSSSGTLLATAAFTGETSYGWQTVTFSSPATIAANTVYIVSFSTGGGYFGVSTNYFNTSGVNSGPLHALANGVSGGDGVYGSSGRFPTSSGNGMNFWADAVFSPTSTSAVRASTAVRPATAAPVAVAPPGGSTVVSPTSASTASPAQVPVTTSGHWPYRRTVPQTRAFLSSSLRERHRGLRE